jgi:hypothetical protein
VLTGLVAGGARCAAPGQEGSDHLPPSWPATTPTPCSESEFPHVHSHARHRAARGPGDTGPRRQRQRPCSPRAEHPPRQPPALTATAGTGCGTCLLAYRIPLHVPDRDGAAREHVKYSKALLSRRGRQGIDLRPDTPAYTLHCTYTDWPFDPDGHDQAVDDTIGHGQDHPDERGAWVVYRIFGIDLEHQRASVELDAEMTPNPSDRRVYRRTPQARRSRPDKPHLYRFRTDRSRLHTAVVYHLTDAGTCAPSSSVTDACWSASPVADQQGMRGNPLHLPAALHRTAPSRPPVAEVRPRANHPGYGPWPP